MFVLPGRNGLRPGGTTASSPKPPKTGAGACAAGRDRLEQEQEDDCARDGEQERAEAPTRVHLVTECNLPDKAADQRADDANRDRREAPDRLASRCDEAGDEAGDEAEEQEGDDAHGVT